MFEITIHTLREKRAGIIAFSIFIFVFGFMMVAGFDSIGQNIDLDELLSEYPESLTAFFGKSIDSFGDFGGFYTLEYVQWTWFLIIPAYLAMICSGFIAGEIENKTADTLLSYPVSRRKMLLEKYSSVIIAVLFLNMIGIMATYVGIQIYGIDYSIKWVAIAMLQAVPFLLTWCAIFTLLSTVFSESKKASTFSIAVVFVAYFVDVLSVIWSEFKLIGNISPMHYFDPGKVMSKNIVSWSDTIILVIMACAIISIATYIFEKKDIL